MLNNDLKYYRKITLLRDNPAITPMREYESTMPSCTVDRKNNFPFEEDRFDVSFYVTVRF